MLQRLSPYPSWLTSERSFGHQNLVPTFPGIDKWLMVTRRDILKWKRHYDKKSQNGSFAGGWLSMYSSRFLVKPERGIDFLTKSVGVNVN